MDFSNTVVASSEMLTSNMVDEAIVLNLPKGIYYGLNKVGLRTWQLIQQPQCISDIYSTLLEEYDADPDQCKKDLLAFLQDLYQQKLIEVQ
ncbi:MAG: PqqD family protein [Cyanobacteria bacterium P01_F01_bin.150]